MNKGKTINEIATGDGYEHVFEVTDEAVRLFAQATGDKNPVHLDEKFAEGSIFKQRVAHGMLSAGFISAVLGTMFPGVGTIYLSQTLQFKRPVFIGDRVAVRLTAAEKKEEKNRLLLETVCVNQEGETVAAGEAWVMPPS